MYLVSVTNYQVDKDFPDYNFNQIKIESMYLTAITDSFFSKVVFSHNKISIIESPLNQNYLNNNLTYNKIEYNKENKEITFHKSTLSGRAVYYYFDLKGNFFCSSHISLLKKIGVVIEENINVIPEFFLYYYITPPETYYKNIQQLLSGNELTVKILPKKCIIKSIKLLELSRKKNEIDTVNNVSKKISNYLLDTIKKLDPIKDTIAILLSGGLDSSILYKMFESNYPTGVTYSAGYPFEHIKENREKEYALTASKIFNTDHKYLEVTKNEFIQGVIESISIAEEPVPYHAVLFHMLFKKGIPKNKKLIVCGQGADTLFGSGLNVDIYNRKKKWKYKLLKHNFILNILLFLLSIINNIKLKNALKIYVMINRKTNSIKNMEENYIWDIDLKGNKNWICEYFNVKPNELIKGRFNLISIYSEYSIFDITTLLTLFTHIQGIQSIISKLGESQGKSILFPYTEDNLIQFSFEISDNIKFEKPKSTLRKVARMYNIPSSIIDRPKSGIGIRNSDWAKKGGPFEPLIPIASKIVDPKIIRDLQTSDGSDRITFWNVLSYSIWKRLFINGESVDEILKELK